jgi:hypothetical protein
MRSKLAIARGGALFSLMVFGLIYVEDSFRPLVVHILNGMTMLVFYRVWSRHSYYASAPSAGARITSMASLFRSSRSILYLCKHCGFQVDQYISIYS